MKRRILVIESDDAGRQAICDLLGDSFAIIEAESNKEALKLVREHYREIDLVLAGYKSLSQDQYRLIVLMKRNTALGPIPVICYGDIGMTEQLRLDAEREALRHGAIEFVQPPFDAETLSSRIENLVSLRENTPSVKLSHTVDALKKYDRVVSKGTFWNPESLDTMIMRTYVGAVCILEFRDEQITILRANERFALELLGINTALEELECTELDRYMKETERRKLLQTVDEAEKAQGEASCQLLLHAIRDDQPVVHVQLAVRLVERAGERRIFYCSLQNDTEQFEARRRERALMEQLKVIIQNASGGISAVSVQGEKLNYIYTNEKYYSMFGYTKEQFEEELPDGVFDLILPEYIPAVWNALGLSAEEATEKVLDFEAKRRDGGRLWIRGRSTPCHFDEIDETVYIIVLVDITLEVKAQERIRTINDRLGNSDVLIQLDVTNRRIEEYRSKYETPESVRKWREDGEIYENRLLADIYEEDRPAAMEAWSFAGLAKHYAAGDSTLTAEYRRHLPTGEIHWFRATAVLLEGVSSGTVSAVIYARDIDSEKKDRIAHDAIVGSDFDAILIVNIASGKARAVKIFDEAIVPQDESYNFDEVTQRFLSGTIAKKDRERCKEFFLLNNLLERLKRQSDAEISYWILLPDGYSRRMNNHVSFLDNTHEDILIIGRDITALFEKEQDQQQALQQAVELANEASRAKSDFLSRMSHDMRTPLNAILGLTEIVRQENKAPEIEEYLRSIDSAGNYLLGLINDTLDLSKIESGKLELHEEPFPLEDFVLGLNTVIKPLMDAKNIKFVMKLDDKAENIIVDRLRFTQIFYNLLSNAAKYTPEGGRVELASEPIPALDGKFGMRFYVRDNGIGMSEPFQKILFDPFTQEYRPEEAERKGTGLGLAIVKSIVDATGGTISVKSEPGKGTEFMLDLYAYNISSQRPAETDDKCDLDKLVGVRVLLVDDAEINLLIVSKVLMHRGCVVETACNGLDALRAFEASPPDYYDIILTDVRMPVMNGLEEARAIREMERPDAATVPIIVATADAFTDENDSIFADVNARLVKPIKSDLLCKTIVQQLELAEAEEARRSVRIGG